MGFWKKSRICTYLSMIPCFFSAFSIFFVTYVVDLAYKNKNNIPMYLVGVIFWFGLLLTGILQIIATISRKKAVNYGFGVNTGKGIGIFNFFKNTEAIVFDVLMFVSILFFIIELVFKVNSGAIVYTTFFLLVYSVNMHGILNGKNYIYAKENKTV